MALAEAKNIELAIVENIRKFPVDKQQQVLDFVEFLKTKLETTEDLSGGTHPERNRSEPESFLTLAGKYIGCVEGPEDLSTNKKYFEGFGK
jgi:hypothetical protein